MYSPNRNPTELYHESLNERYALLRQEARNRRLALPLATPSTMLVVIVVFVGLAAIVVGPGKAIDFIGTHLVHVLSIFGSLVVVVGLLMEGGKVPDDGTEPPRQILLAYLSTNR
ncbi:MAG: hypothetical protein M3P70_10240 [Actinomycetota bacterium]|nr:hypothetical protein [Actinomycetota bacterium]